MHDCRCALLTAEDCPQFVSVSNPRHVVILGAGAAVGHRSQELALSAVEGTATAGRVLPSKRCFDCVRSLYAITPLRMTRGEDRCTALYRPVATLRCMLRIINSRMLAKLLVSGTQANPAPALNKGGSLRHYGRERGATWFIIGSVDRAFLFYEHA